MDRRAGSCVGVLVVLVVLGVVLVSVGYFANVQAVKAQTGEARATAQAELLARSTPMSDVAIVALGGMDEIARVAESGFDSNARIAASGDAAQTAMSMAWCASSWAWPVGLLAVVVILFLLRSKGNDNHERGVVKHEG